MIQKIVTASSRIKRATSFARIVTKIYPMYAVIATNQSIPKMKKLPVPMLPNYTKNIMVQN